MAKVKVLHVVPAFYPAVAYGGPIESVYQLCRRLSEHDCEVRVLTTDANGPNATLDVDTVNEISLGPSFRVRYCHRIAADAISPTFLRELPSYVRWADVVHLTAVYSFPTIPTLAASRSLMRSVVWSPRGALQRWERSTKLGAKAVWERLCHALAPSNLILHVTSEEEAQQSLTRIPSDKVVVIPNGVEIPEQIINKRIQSVLRLVYLGRLHPIKGIENLLSACHEGKAYTKSQWSLMIAGEGDSDYLDVLRRQATKLGLGAQVTFMGDVRGKTKRALFEDADVVVVPSHTENFGMVVAEALAHAVPVIASKGTPWKRMEEVGCGLWVDNNPESLAKAIELMSRMPLREMGLRGQKWMQEEFAWPSVAAQMAKLYHNLTIHLQI